ncbi:putative rRNA methylase [Plesiocystis pacifica SIR-1]|uniref:Putative rRNA methylase n=2 Tax=Plesiocystis pacifica TaxID=191768 RepID=A6G9V0_9BACT|nr:putative rRNA methylase [Plesiocystis pacifica SIR-1]
MLMTLLGVFYATQLTITTSRFGLVHEDNWYQRRMLDFFDAFGYPDSPVVIVRGGTPEDRRETVDRYVEKLEADPLFEGRVLAKIDAESVSETLLIQEPGALAELRRQLPPEADLPGAIEEGLEGVFGLLEGQMLAALDGELEVDPKQSAEGLERLGALAKALDGKLAEDAGQGEPVDGAALLEALAGEELSERLPTDEDMRERGLDPEGYFISNDGEHLLVAVFPEFGGDEVDDYGPAVETMRSIQKELDYAGDTELLLTGLPFLVIDEEGVLANGLMRVTIGTGVGIFLLLTWAFRSLRRTIAALIPIAVGTAVSLGALRILFESLDPISSAFGAVLMGLAIDFPVHLIARYDEDLRKGRTRGEALRSALCKAGPGVVTGAVTTGLAFLTVATTEFTSYGELGMVTAIGLFVSLVVSLIVLPLVFGRGDLEAKETPAEPRKIASSVARIAGKAPILVVGASVLFALIGTALTPDYNPRYLDYLPPGFEPTKALRVLENDGAMSPWFAFATADDIEQARDRAEDLREQSSVAHVDSPSDLLPELDDAKLAKLRADFEGLEREPDWAKLADRQPKAADLKAKVQDIVDALDELSFAAEQADQGEAAAAKIAATKEAFEGLAKRLETVPAERAGETLDAIENDMAAYMGPAWGLAAKVAERGHWEAGDLPPMFRKRFVATDGSERLALFVYPTPDVHSGLDGNIAAKRFAEQLESIDPQAAGQGVTLYRHNLMIVHGFQRATFFSACLVIVLLLLDFASLRKALLAIFPVVIGMGWMLGIFGLLNLRISVASIVVLPLMLGIGIDAGVHMMHRWEINATHNGGVARIREVVEGTGGAVLLSSLTTMVGFAGLLLGRHRGMMELGGTMVIGIACTLIASVVVLPALLVALDRAK